MKLITIQIVVKTTHFQHTIRIPNFKKIGFYKIYSTTNGRSTDSSWISITSAYECSRSARILRRVFISNDVSGVSGANTAWCELMLFWEWEATGSLELFASRLTERMLRTTRLARTQDIARENPTGASKRPTYRAMKGSNGEFGGYV